MQRAVCKMPRKMSQIPEVERVVGKRKNGTDRKMLLYLMDTAVVGRLLRVQRK